ncbi:helicase [Clostridium carboxidivorans P7]|uniref:DEAD/DEAH box helicase domain protein n=1 Tax=Clostridium carboxidivorans P7 TaxID=536227 RepID=C6PSI7_9CLOT|nr:DEAD/DEAH box helicase [Clostridium carboxidivorans]AKN30616.1 helicase [Clostridium carboxidivorans P7]EET87761.1 DEAD/DEAH box helicase domain protein [Clostridium carboxidivorans P7]EFG86369.1 DEAD/DEAH box helicase [Clostridium carboxidivorans P7]
MTKTLFKELGINEKITEGLKKEGIEYATEIQVEAIPQAILNKDIVGEAETGSGKTLAYLAPIFQNIDTNSKAVQAFILTPTHELAIQVNDVIKTLAEDSEIPVKSAAIIGNINIKKQIENLKNNKPHIVVGSTGRILQLIKLKKMKAHMIKTIVVDEADKLLDKNNVEDVKAIIKTTLKDRQLMFFSATIDERTLDVAKTLMKEYEVIRTQGKTSMNENIEHMCFKCEQRDKILILRKVFHILNPKKAIVFVNKPDEIEVLTEKLNYHGIKSESIYGTADKEVRKRALEDFKAGKINLLVASDIAARGLDIQDVECIFSYDIPEDTDNYLHRAGRTARAGKAGKSICIFTDREQSLIKQYEKTFNIKINLKDMYKGKIIERR